MEETHPDYVEGYRDGYDLNCPEPSDNRSLRYKHSFAIGRSEKTNSMVRPFLSYQECMNRVAEIERIES